MAGRNPPTRATTTTTSRNSSTSLTRLRCTRALASARVSSGGSSTASAAPCSRRRSVRLPCARGSPRPLPDLGVGDQVDVDVAGLADGGGPDARAAEQRREPGSAAAAEHELGGVLRPGELQQGLGHVVADDLVVGAAEGLHQLPLRGEVGGAGAGEPVRAGDVHRQQVAAGGPGSDAGCAPDQRLALGAAGDRDDDPFPGLPGALDVVLGAVGLQRLVDLVRGPQQRQLSQRGQVPDPEVVARARRRPWPPA